MLESLLRREEVACHPFIVGELACGNLANRDEILRLLQALPQTRVVMYAEVLIFIESHQLMGRGIGLIDAHLLASAVLDGVHLWTRDRRLRDASATLNVSFD